jgi:hypothetical protein
VRGGQDTSQRATVLHRFTQSDSSHDDLPLMHMKTGATHFVNAAVACDEVAMDCSCNEQQLHGVVFSGHVMRNPCSVTPLQILKPCQTGRDSGFELNALFRCIVTLSRQTSRGLVAVTATMYCSTYRGIPAGPSSPSAHYPHPTLT